MSSKKLQDNLNLLKKEIEQAEGESIVGGAYVLLYNDDLQAVVNSCSALLEHFGMDLDTREIMGG